MANSSSLNIPKLSLMQALLLNLNIIIGAGIFVNSMTLSRAMAGLSWLSYLAVAIVTLPLVLALSHLIALHEGGSFYQYTRPLGPNWAFISQMSYFIGKLGAATLGSLLAVQFMQTLMPNVLPQGSPASLWLTIGVIVGLAILATGNIKIAQGAQYLFLTSKLFSIVTVMICAAISILNSSEFIHSINSVPSITITPTLFLSTMALSIYSFTGFEATCSLASRLKRPVLDGPRAIIGSFIISVVLAILFHLSMWQLAGSALMNPQASIAEIMEHIITGTIGNTLFAKLIKALALLGIIFSCLGAAYGSLYSNGYNLLLATNYMHPKSRAIIQRKNDHGSAFWVYIISAACMIWYLLSTQGTALYLQQINCLGLITTFTLSSFGGFFTSKLLSSKVLYGLAITSCLALMVGLLISAQMSGAGAIAVLIVPIAIAWMVYQPN